MCPCAVLDVSRSVQPFSSLSTLLHAGVQILNEEVAIIPKFVVQTVKQKHEQFVSQKHKRSPRIVISKS